MTTHRIKSGHPEYLTPASEFDGPSAIKECTAIGPNGRYACTRIADHAGDHAAHGTNDDQLARWSDADLEKTNG